MPAVQVASGKVLLVAVSNPFKWTPLHFVAKEIESIKAAIPSHVPMNILGDFDGSEIKPTGPPTAKAILNKLPDASILHLACHGHQHPQNALDSGFVMQDSMLTVAKLMELNLDKAFLAFLSACETAKGDEAQTDQAIHLAATMLFAGFRSVVGTMWYAGVNQASFCVTYCRHTGRWMTLMVPLLPRPCIKSCIAQELIRWIPTLSRTLWTSRSAIYGPKD